MIKKLLFDNCYNFHLIFFFQFFFGWNIFLFFSWKTINGKIRQHQQHTRKLFKKSLDKHTKGISEFQKEYLTTLCQEKMVG